MILAEFLPALPDRSWKITRQIGVTHAIVKAAPDLTGLQPPWEIDSLFTIQKRFETEGFTLAGLEGDQFDMRRIKLGLPGRDADLELYCRMLRNMGELGVPLLCYNFMATIGWFRTNCSVPTRGGALTSRFKLAEVEEGAVPECQQITRDKLWENYAYFIQAVLPAAESAGVKMGLHPDDPPVSSLRGVGRIFCHPTDLARALSLSDSPSHGLTFCQATFVAMGADLSEVIPQFAPRIQFIHFRDIRGNSESFEETFQDDGQTDMAAALGHYRDAHLSVPIRVDHVPTMEGEENDHPGYALMGRVFALGYLKGLLSASGIAFS